MVSLTGDTALLAATLALTQQQQHQQQGGAAHALAVAAAAGALLATWVAGARDAVVQSGLLSEAAMAALLAQWDPQPVLQQAAAQLVGSSIGGEAGVAQARRSMQRSLRQLADAIRRAHNGSPGVQLR